MLNLMINESYKLSVMPVGGETRVSREQKNINTNLGPHLGLAHNLKFNLIYLFVILFILVYFFLLLLSVLSIKIKKVNKKTIFGNNPMEK